MSKPRIPCRTAPIPMHWKPNSPPSCCTSPTRASGGTWSVFSSQSISCASIPITRISTRNSSFLTYRRSFGWKRFFTLPMKTFPQPNGKPQRKLEITMETTGKQEMRIAVKCKQCNMTIFYKTTPSTGIIECKCPRCRKITEINLAYRRSRTPLFYRRSADYPLSTTILQYSIIAPSNGVCGH